MKMKLRTLCYLRTAVRKYTILHGGEKIWILCSSGRNKSSCRENIKFISLSKRVMLLLLYRRKKKRIYSKFQHLIASACSLATGISFLSSSVARKSLSNFKSYEVFFFVLTCCCSSGKDFTSSSDNFTDLMLAIFDFLHKHPRKSGKLRHWYLHCLGYGNTPLRSRMQFRMNFTSGVFSKKRPGSI